MAILQSGVPKSGNYWLFKILSSITRYAGLEQKSFIQNHPIHPVAKEWKLSFAEQSDMDFLTIDEKNCYFRISAVFREKIPDIDDYISQCSQVWTHSPINSLAVNILPKFDKIVYIIRDPRDVAISYAKFAFTPHKLANHAPHHEKNPTTYLKNRLEEMMRHWVRHVGGYLKNREKLNIYPIFYERLLHSFDSELRGLLNYLEIELGAKEIEQIKHEVAFKTMKQTSPNHLRQGTANQWKTVLDEPQKQQTIKIAGSMMKLLNYPLLEQEECLPSCPLPLNLNQLETAIQCTDKNLQDYVGQVYKFVTSDRTAQGKMNLVKDKFLEKLARFT